MPHLSDGNSFVFEGVNSIRKSATLFFEALNIPSYLRLLVPRRKSGSNGLPTEARFFGPQPASDAIRARRRILDRARILRQSESRRDRRLSVGCIWEAANLDHDGCRHSRVLVA